MREYSKIPVQFWINQQGRRIRKLGLETQLVALYLVTNSHATMLGIYYLPATLVAHEIGLSQEEAINCLAKLSDAGFCTYDEQSEFVWVHEMAAQQISHQLKPNDNRIKSIHEALVNLPELPFLPMFYEKYGTCFYLDSIYKNIISEQAPSKALQSQEQEQYQEQIQNQKEKKDFLSGKHEKIASLKTQAKEVLEFLNHKTERMFRLSDTNLNLIMARLKSGASVMDCRQVIAKKTRMWMSDEKMSQYLRPATLFNATKFEQYLGELLPVEERKS